MEEALLVQSLDSLWFFSSVFSSSKVKPNFQSFDGEIAMQKEPETPISPISQSGQNELSNADLAAETEKLPSNVSDLGNAVEETEDQNVAAKKEEKCRRRKRRRKRKVLGELELGIDLRYNYERCNGSGICRLSEKHLEKMPPLSDGMAMKEHIKCWAYAIACTVR